MKALRLPAFGREASVSTGWNRPDSDRDWISAPIGLIQDLLRFGIGDGVLDTLFRL